MTLKDTCTALSFSPNGKYFAMGVGSLLRIWKTPALFKEFAPLVLHLDVPKQHFDDITYIEWSPDSKFVMFSVGILTDMILSELSFLALKIQL